MLKRGWFGGVWKPKNPHSLEHLRYLYTVLNRSQIVQDNNRNLLVETLRSIAEILIWGDQNDSSVFDYFLEKNMLSFFLKIMRQKCGSYVCVQLLQTLNILFENIRNETSLYYLLSNNHVNSIIVHKFDFSDEEIMAYYISFLKTLSLKLNSHTIHFFYNEHTNDFPLYTEAIKFFNHPESMVRIAVRTLTLNVYKVDYESMQQFIRDKTAAPYFSNLVWFIGNHILELDACVRTDMDHSSRDRLADLVAEHLDHLHYLNDILSLNILKLNQVLSDHILNRLLVPLLIYSLNHHLQQGDRPHVSRVVALFLLAQVFLIFSYPPLIQILARIILHGNNSVFDDHSSAEVVGINNLRPGFVAPIESLEKSLQHGNQIAIDDIGSHRSDVSETESQVYPFTALSENSCCSGSESQLSATAIDADYEDSINQLPLTHNSFRSQNNSVPSRNFSQGGISQLAVTHVNITDEQKQQLKYTDITSDLSTCELKKISPSMQPFLQAVMDSLNCQENDYSALFSLCLLYAIGHNTGINKDLIASSMGHNDIETSKLYYNTQLVDLLLNIISLSAQYNSRIRISTLEMGLNVLRHLMGLTDASSSGTRTVFLKDPHLAILEGAKEEATLLLRSFYKGEEMFLDMFEDEWGELMKKPLNVEYLLQDSSILLPPAGTPLTGIDFNKRLPCGEVERAKQSMRVFFHIRALCLRIKGESDPHLPLTNPAACVQVTDVLDLNNSDLIACVVITREGARTRRFLVIDVIQLILVEPDQRRLGWGVSKFVGFLQDLEVVGDKDDSRVLHITIHRPTVTGSQVTPLLAAKFIFDDHIRCMAAKQRLTKGRLKARQRKLHQITRLLDMPFNLQPCPSPPAHALSTMRQEAQKRNSRSDLRSRSVFHRPVFSHLSKGPGVALKRENAAVSDERRSSSVAKESNNLESRGRRRASASKNGSRSTSRHRPLSEEIPLENLCANVATAKSAYPDSPKCRQSCSEPAATLVSENAIPIGTATEQRSSGVSPGGTSALLYNRKGSEEKSLNLRLKPSNHPPTSHGEKTADESIDEPTADLSIERAQVALEDPKENETSFCSRTTVPNSSSFDVFEQGDGHHRSSDNVGS